MSWQDLYLLPGCPSPDLLVGTRARHARDTGESSGTADNWEPSSRVRPGRHVPSAEPLTERETEVLRLLHGSLPAREIGVELGLSRNTIKTHVKAIYRKLGVSTRAAAIAQYPTLRVIPGRRHRPGP
jgi:LuxR family maltose regulon positive regulatory protein